MRENGMVYGAIGVLLFLFGGVSGELEMQRSYSPKQWCEREVARRGDEDEVQLRNGLSWCGYFECVPPIVYSFGHVPFLPHELSGVAVGEEGKVQYVTKNGQNFIGKCSRDPFVFYEKVVSCVIVDEQREVRVSYRKREFLAEELSFAWMASSKQTPSLIDGRYYSLVLHSGDRFPIEILSPEIHLTSKEETFHLAPQQIRYLECGSSVKGALITEAADRPLPPCYVMDSTLAVQLARNGQTLEIPWRKIRELRNDMGCFVTTLPDCFADDRPSDMVYIPPGRFSFSLEACGEKEGAVPLLVGEGYGVLNPLASPEKRMREVEGFYIDLTEVTNAQYRAFLLATGHLPPSHWDRGRYPQGMGQHPVVNVTFKDAQAFARWVGKRLPTEVEWERAAKGGSGQNYPYGSFYKKQLANTDSGGTCPVGRDGGAFLHGHHPMNTGGWLSDMSSNVAEWTTSDYDASCHLKVVRGGSYASSGLTSQVTHRAPLHEKQSAMHVGFRCVKEAALK